MKKTASLFLFVVLVFCVCTFVLAESVFSDSDSINQLYAEAVEAAVNDNIIGGYTDGTFRPTNNLSRGAAAKIISTYKLGTDEALKLSGKSTPFPDVPADNAYSGYISYCVSENIISGYSDGNFKPFDRLSGYAFAKMLLNTIGFTGNPTRYTGGSWKEAVYQDAVSSGILNQIPSLDAPLTREEAAMMWYSAKTWKENADRSYYSQPKRRGRDRVVSASNFTWV